MSLGIRGGQGGEEGRLGVPRGCHGGYRTHIQVLVDVGVWVVMHCDCQVLKIPGTPDTVSDTVSDTIAATVSDTVSDAVPDERQERVVPAVHVCV